MLSRVDLTSSAQSYQKIRDCGITQVFENGGLSASVIFESNYNSSMLKPCRKTQGSDGWG